MHFSDYTRSSHDDFIQTEELSSSQGALYSVSQRIPPVNTSYSSLCTNDISFCGEQVNYSGMQTEWDRDRTMSNSDTKDTASDTLSDKQTNGKSILLNNI